jgi:hypothetical protein
MAGKARVAGLAIAALLEHVPPNYVHFGDKNMIQY